MSWVLSGCIVLLLILEMIQMAKIHRLIAALALTNKSLNETRTVAQSHEKKIKQLLNSVSK